MFRAKKHFYIRSHRMQKFTYFPLFFFDVDVELANTFQCQFFFFDQNLNWVTHESLCYIQNLSRHSGGKKDDLEGV